MRKSILFVFLVAFFAITGLAEAQQEESGSWHSQRIVDPNWEQGGYPTEDTFNFYLPEGSNWKTDLTIKVEEGMSPGGGSCLNQRQTNESVDWNGAVLGSHTDQGPDFCGVKTYTFSVTLVGGANLIHFVHPAIGGPNDPGSLEIVGEYTATSTQEPPFCQLHPNDSKCKPFVPQGPTLTLPGVNCPIEGLTAENAGLFPSQIDGHTVTVWEYDDVIQGYVGYFGHGTWMAQNETRTVELADNTKFYASWTVVNGMPVYHCWIETTQQKKQLVRYNDCDEKATVEAENKKNPNLDSRDIYVFRPGETAPSNLSVSWPELSSREFSTTLSWNACYLLTIRIIEGEEGQTIWLNYFDSNPIQLMDTTGIKATPFHALEVDAGPNDWFSFVDMNKNIYVADRGGSWKWDLKIQGTNVEWLSHGHQFNYVDLKGMSHIFDVDTRQTVGRTLGNKVFRAHTRNGMQFAPSVLVENSLAVFSQERVGIPSLRLDNTTDIAVNPDGSSKDPESAIFIRESQVWMVQNWMQDSVKGQITNSDWYVWENPDWRN